jgi:hypothetical protein
VGGREGRMTRDLMRERRGAGDNQLHISDEQVTAAVRRGDIMKWKSGEGE